MLKALSTYIFVLRCKLSVGIGSCFGIGMYTIGSIFSNVFNNSSSYFRFTIKPCDFFFIVGISAQYRILSLNCDNGRWSCWRFRGTKVFRNILPYISPRVTTKLNVSPYLMKTLVFVEFLPCWQAPQSSGYSLYLFNCRLFLLSVSSITKKYVEELTIQYELV